MSDGVVNRRTLLRAGAIGAGAVFVPGGVALARGGDRPVLTHGVQSGDVTSDGGLVWTRADRPSRMLVQVSSDPSFRHARTVRGPLLTPETVARAGSGCAACRVGARCTTASSPRTWTAAPAAKP